MHLVLLLDGKITMIVVGVLIGLVVLFLIGLLAYFLIFKNKRLRKSLEVLEERYHRSHSLLFGPCKQYINRLEAISAMNLTYVDEHTQWKRKFNSIRDSSDAQASFSISNLKEYLEERRYKEYKEALSGCRRDVEIFEKEVDELNRSLGDKFRPEDECKSLLLALKDKARALKAQYLAREGDLELVEESFQLLYQNLEGSLKEANELIDDAKYSDAKILLEATVSKVLKALETALVDLPNICISLTRLLPDKTNELEGRYMDLISKGYPLGHLLAKDEPVKIREKTLQLQERTRRFELKGVKKESDELLNRIESLFEKFDREAQSRQKFEETIDMAYKENGYVTSKNVDLVSAFPSMKEIYVIDGTHQEAFDHIAELVNDSSSTKRILDTYLHSAAKQPFSVLLDKAESLLNQSKEAHQGIDAFYDYLLDLKSGAETCYKALPSYFGRLNNSRVCLRQMNIANLYRKYLPRYQECFALIDSLNGVLSTRPIDVAEGLAILAQLQEKSDALINEVDELDEERLQSEKAIVSANRQRLSFAETHSLLLQAEGFYYSGDFARAEASAKQAKAAALISIEK